MSFQIHDRAQVFVSCLSQDVSVGGLRYVGTIERWNNQPVSLPTIECTSNTSLFILVRKILESFDKILNLYMKLYNHQFYKSFVKYILIWVTTLFLFLVGWKHGSCKLRAIYLWWESKSHFTDIYYSHVF